ncbi:hypothetical protein C8R43DRAFT_872772 [Mycena crocata]|nr:hypothetical protein C8R43DRAFT_872772 [Mycena crocata]
MSLVPVHAVSGAAVPSNVVVAPNATLVSDGAVVALAAPFEIKIGNQESSKNVVAWISGQSQCNNAPLSPIGVNPCGRSFSLNGQAFTLEGCGGSNGLWVQNVPSSKGTFAFCSGFSEKDSCTVHTLWHCI